MNSQLIISEFPDDTHSEILAIFYAGSHRQIPKLTLSVDLSQCIPIIMHKPLPLKLNCLMLSGILCIYTHKTQHIKREMRKIIKLITERPHKSSSNIPRPVKKRGRRKSINTTILSAAETKENGDITENGDIINEKGNIINERDDVINERGDFITEIANPLCFVDNPFLPDSSDFMQNTVEFLEDILPEKPKQNKAEKVHNITDKHTLINPTKRKKRGVHKGTTHKISNIEISNVEIPSHFMNFSLPPSYITSCITTLISKHKHSPLPLPRKSEESEFSLMHPEQVAYSYTERIFSTDNNTDNNSDNNNNSVIVSERLCNARWFHNILVQATEGRIIPKQTEPYSEIYIEYL